MSYLSSRIFICNCRFDSGWMEECRRVSHQNHLRGAYELTKCSWWHLLPPSTFREQWGKRDDKSDSHQRGKIGGREIGTDDIKLIIHLVYIFVDIQNLKHKKIVFLLSISVWRGKANSIYSNFIIFILYYTSILESWIVCLKSKNNITSNPHFPKWIWLSNISLTCRRGGLKKVRFDPDASCNFL